MRNALAHAGKSGRRIVSAFIAFAQDDGEAAKGQWRKVADQLRPKLPKLACDRFGGAPPPTNSPRPTTGSRRQNLPDETKKPFNMIERFLHYAFLHRS
jgi:hypothetical protein